MTTQLNARRFTKRGACLIFSAAFALIAFLAVGVVAQDAKDKDKEKEKAPAKTSGLLAEWSCQGSIGDVDDAESDNGQRTPAGLKYTPAMAKTLADQKLMGGTAYCAVYKYVGEVPGDTFGTGMPNIDGLFEPGRSYKE